MRGRVLWTWSGSIDGQYGYMNLDLTKEVRCLTYEVIKRVLLRWLVGFDL